ncbi:hypothetical protein RHSIM_RhsimUnG0146100 [Rhododendron simsii]|uniref:Integrase catalytic domain-containing protein n=1 Tax=Rhododendron simsii TaxID=118357 RepID=A0A834FWQ8_RHOSS|nr:hypothetical protein RHSIM_RhsimUnG0146100 [Rhododendron simsii]
MRSDRGGEFTSNEFNDFCEENGICRPLTLPYSPQQNGVVERKNRSILNVARMPEQKRSKLDDRSEKYVFIGYDSRSKGYKLYNPSNGKVISSRDVVFDEEGTWNWETQEEEQYDFFPSFQESWEEREKPQEPMTPPSSPTPNQEVPSSEESSSERPHRMRNLQELYEARAITVNVGVE